MPTTRFTSKKVRGSIIAFSLLVLSILLSSGLAVVSVAVLEKKSGLATQKSVIALQAADSGAERILERIYGYNSPGFLLTPLNSNMPADVTLNSLAANLPNANARVCNAGTNRISARNNANPVYTFEATFFDSNGNVIACGDNRWRDRVVRLRVEGFFRNTSRVIELGIKQRPECGETDIVTYGGIDYSVVVIGDQCWLDRNLRFGNRVPSSTVQSSGVGPEYYCWSDAPGQCTNPNTNEGDGGLYTWQEAMNYTTAERARGLCPNNFHVPSDDEWCQLEHYLDPSATCPASDGARGATTGLQIKPDGVTGFEANLAGKFDGAGGSGFVGRGTYGLFWTSTSTRNGALNRYEPFTRSVDSTDAIQRFSGSEPRDAASLRCIKD